MKEKILGLVVLIGLGLMISGPAFAHHGDAAFNVKKLITVKGTVTGFTFFNPHTEVFIRIMYSNGNVVEWRGEMSSPNMLAREGWTRSTLKKGEKIELVGYPAKNGEPTLRVRKVIASNGKELYPPAGTGEGKSRPPGGA